MLILEINYSELHDYVHNNALAKSIHHKTANQRGLDDQRGGELDV